MKNIILFIIIFVPYIRVLAQTDSVIKQGKIQYNVTGSGITKNSDFKQFIVFRNQEAIVSKEYKSLLDYGVSYNTWLFLYQNEKIMMNAVLSDSPSPSGLKGNKKHGLYSVLQDSSRIPLPNINIVYQKEFKTIVGHKCQKAEITVTGYNPLLNQEVKTKYIAYYTDKIKNQFSLFKGLKGLPLEYQLEDGSEIYTATQIDPDFVIPQELTFQSLYPAYRFIDSKSREAQDGLKVYQEVMKKQGRN